MDFIACRPIPNMEIEKEIVKRLKQRYPNVFIKENLIKLCTKCEVEHNINETTISKNGWNVSSGKCPSHFIEALQHSGLNAKEILDMALQQSTKPLDKSPRGSQTQDLSKADEVLIEWLKFPTRYQ
jgi:hypothetical protein